MIHVENITKDYDGYCAVDQISFDIKKGEIIGLLGPNGAGKTTTLRMLTGFLKPSQGEIQIKELSVNEHPLSVKKLIGYLPESAPLYHDMLVFDYLRFVSNIRELKGEKQFSRIRQLSDLCGLSNVMHKSINELSKGYKQRVGLAHAMMSDPEILILDEPTSGLDPNQIIEIRDIIRKIGKEKTVILSTHILSEAEATCDRIIIINNGKIAADSPTEELKRSASGEFSIFLSLNNTVFDQVQNTLTPIDGISKISLIEDQNNSLQVRLHCNAKNDIRESIYNKIKQTDWGLLEFYQKSQSLENIFRELTKEN